MVRKPLPKISRSVPALSARMCKTDHQYSYTGELTQFQIMYMTAKILKSQIKISIHFLVNACISLYTNIHVI